MDWIGLLLNGSYCIKVLIYQNT